MLDAFGVQVQPGTSLKTLNSGQGYFQSEGISIVRYNFTTDSCKQRRAKTLALGDLKKCTICEQNLYEASAAEEPIVRQKKMLIFLDASGREYSTCYKLKSCLTRVGFKSGKNHYIEYRPPTFMEFLDVSEEELSTSAKDRDLMESATVSYERYVVPFISKWVNRALDKSNVLEFVEDHMKLSPHFVYYEETEEKQAARAKILTMIGVTT